jgi:hypothetical protein
MLTYSRKSLLELTILCSFNENVQNQVSFKRSKSLKEDLYPAVALLGHQK